jgi:hypothetical protein
MDDAAAPRSRLANDTVVTEDRPHRTVKVGANDATVSQVILARRATNVPFTAVPTGSQRTVTDNTKVALSCVDPRFTRSRTWPIWL